MKKNSFSEYFYFITKINLWQGMFVYFSVSLMRAHMWVLSGFLFFRFLTRFWVFLWYFMLTHPHTCGKI